MRFDQNGDSRRRRGTGVTVPDPDVDAPCPRRWKFRPIGRQALLLLAGVMPGVVSAGCSYSGGEFLFATGLFKRPTVKAEFKLTEEPVAVLVDDYQELCSGWPDATELLARRVIEELSEHGGATQLIPTGKVRMARQSHPDFDQMAFTAVGREVGATQVVAIEIRDFQATEEPAEAHAGARIGAAVKVVAVHQAEGEHSARLWPTNASGKSVGIELSASEVRLTKTRAGLLNELADRLAVKIGRFFYDRPMDDFEG